ncbi:UvrD-helicase domain-containing protein [Lacibacter sediminis]|uniref:DNA 3'-5' helicase n=1 Tax=Lacibacter sediminis TaxID=2760713 RepID=A0A7G5XLW1_9BACT|nr:ATP-dependent helicase [Lacibacter sediminis]QNA46464.1 ATP-dependent helicase [Lacibacter sediminis]
MNKRVNITIEELWAIHKFSPNDNQREAILYGEGPLLLTAGPGSGKTRVLLWRTLNLIVFHAVAPEEIFLATFTEKAAQQLKDGLRTLLGTVTNLTGKPYDISKMSLGTVHSICQSLITDRRFSSGRVRKNSPILMDSLSQYFKIYQKRFWQELWVSGEFTDEESANLAITKYLLGKEINSRHVAVTECIALFNRFSEENIIPDAVQTNDVSLRGLLKMYSYYRNSLQINPNTKQVDFSLLQQEAFTAIENFTHSGNVFKYLIIDEYQDTNAIQEKLYFSLAKGSKNICVVGDDDQALYRFRGATVENLVEFENRCKQNIGIKPKRIDLDINYRSRKNIVDLYTHFIVQTDWKNPTKKGSHFRVHDKVIKAHSKDAKPSVVVSERDKADNVYAEIAQLVVDLKRTGKITDYNQCAFLFPSMKFRGEINTRVAGFQAAFENLGVPVYAPRAGSFVEVDEARAIFGLFLKIFDRPHYGATGSQNIIKFRNWMIGCMQYADNLMKEDKLLKEYVEDRKNDVATALADYNLLLALVKKKKWNVKDPFQFSMIRDFAEVAKLSPKAKKNLTNSYFRKVIELKEKENKPYSIDYIINRTTSLDWTVLDLFYQLNGFRHFRDMYLLAEDGTDEGPVCNLGLLSQYLSRFMEQYGTLLTASFMSDEKFVRVFFASYVYALYRLGESEYEDADDPFPKGRVPFLTIHQSKGLEFPVVVLGAVYKGEKPPDKKEVIVRHLLNKEGEPLDRISHFDNMRMFYVGLSRAQNLLVLPRYTYAAAATDIFKNIFENYPLQKIADLDLKHIPVADEAKQDLGKSYSYTSDYLLYNKCPRNYMIFKKYGFVPSRSQTMLFGSLVHQTIEDLHHLLIYERKNAAV